MEDKRTKSPILTPQEMEDVKLKELIERFNLLTKEFFDLGYELQPFNQPGIRIVKRKKKSDIIPVDGEYPFSPLKR